MLVHNSGTDTRASGRRAERAETVHLLMVDDSPADLQLMRIALQRSKVKVDLAEATSGPEALRYLRREGPYANSRRPDMVLLDINMPGMDGKEVLAEIKRDPNLRRIPVVILTSSRLEQDVLDSYDRQAACYLVKPLDFERFQEVVQRLDQFWIGLVTFPKENDHRF